MIIVALSPTASKAAEATVDVAPQKRSQATFHSFSSWMASATASTYIHAASSSSVEPTPSHGARSNSSFPILASTFPCSFPVRDMPLELKTLRPLYSGGLWLAVTATPASASSSLVSQAMTGVGRSPTSFVSAPHEAMPEARAAANISPVVLASLPTTTVPPSWIVARAAPSLWARAGVISTLTRPLIPEEPKSFTLNASLGRICVGGQTSKAFPARGV